MWQILFLKLPAPLMNLGAVAMPDGILIVGGHDGSQPSKRVYRITGDKIKSVASMIDAPSNFCCVTLPTFDFVYTISDNQTQVYDYHNDMWV
jgi:hypothetical protein